ncbi:hypothetical protein AX14_004070 [Amanita brunnescens Koide BX004]|nr:hypothetical protein AX14_004070 [Amanita brunnescens Koide BX004]
MRYRRMGIVTIGQGLVKGRAGLYDIRYLLGATGISPGTVFLLLSQARAELASCHRLRRRRISRSLRGYFGVRYQENEQCWWEKGLAMDLHFRGSPNPCHFHSCLFYRTNLVTLNFFRASAAEISIHESPCLAIRFVVPRLPLCALLSGLMDSIARFCSLTRRLLPQADDNR